MTADPNNSTGETSETDAIGYADAMAELDEILGELDDDDIDIDVLSERVERAAQLIAICRGRIGTAQERVAGIVAGMDDPSAAADNSLS